MNPIYYWESRYKEGKTSGAGSYGDKALYKAKVLNSIIEDTGLSSLIEFGCGDGNNLQYYNIQSYTGLDVSRIAIKKCIEKYKDDTTKGFLYYEPELFKSGTLKADITISFEVIFHLTDDNMYKKYMQDLFNTSDRYVLIFSSNSNAKESTSPHIKHREFSLDVPSNFNFIGYVKTPESGSLRELFSDFYLFKKKL